MARYKEFPKDHLQSTLDEVQSCLNQTEHEFAHDKEISDSIKQLRKTVARVSAQLNSQ